MRKDYAWNKNIMTNPQKYDLQTTIWEMYVNNVVISLAYFNLL